MMALRPFWWWRADTRGAEVTSAVLAWAWGLMLLAPHDTFADVPGYRLMAAFAPEWAWGLFYLAVGGLQSLAMCGNVNKLRFPAAIVALVGWTAAACTFLVVNPYTHAPIVYGVLAAMQLWVIVRGPQDHGE